MDVDTRLLRYFAAVAEEGHLTRAAERLYVSQPALTKQIRQLEKQLGVQLFVRTPGGMRLTEAGRALADRVPAVLDGLAEALRRTRQAARRAEQVVRAGFLAGAAGEATQAIIAAFGRRRPGWRVEMRHASWSAPTADLVAGDVDVALLPLPLPGQEELRVEVLLTEPRWVVMAEAHPLAVREELAFRELWDEPFVAAPAEAGAWRDYWLATEGREGREPRIGAVADNPDDWLSAVANGYGIALAPASAARYYARPGVAYRPLTGVAPNSVAVVWKPAADADPVVRDFVGCCLEYRQQPSS
ncbi:LysR family transcriptional regulator [Streptomyces sp. TRM66268-LWL]|uniref:LysR family transcriptional regulator n=1 Tax=Streptomyces polyasparticus TaxID=2767826 RepID=A0ABR7SEP7_9ACTN|nr:LysR family transcriptional regulator [Streptomyces polyasparticus]MBC9713992.1 LysR family transcriptional regulator [Streptomyces polyasparticus]